MRSRVALTAPLTLARVKGPVACPAGFTLPPSRYAAADRMLSEGLASRWGSSGSGSFVVIRTVSAPSAVTVRVVSERTRGFGDAFWAAVSERAAAAASSFVPSWKAAPSRTVKTQARSPSRFQEVARAGLASPFRSSRVSPSTTASH